MKIVKIDIKKKIWKWIVIINKTRFAIVLKYLSDYCAMLEYYIYDLLCLIKGYRMPSNEERELVRANVTFIYKSFERQKMAKQLYKNISKFYPDTKIVIADDSKEKLRLSGKNVTVINLPFNMGLSYGLNQALKRVDTPYVIRLDDDMLLTRRTHVGEQLEFLNKHSEIDIVGFGILNAFRLERPDAYIKKYYSQSMSYAPRALKIPHMTRIDENHLVLGKGMNLFLIKTEKLKEIGYDNNIRMIDHDDFYYRAAGNLVSVVAEDTRLYHRHNLFDSLYQQYRYDIEGDINYIRKARNS